MGVVLLIKLEVETFLGHGPLVRCLHRNGCGACAKMGVANVLVMQCTIGDRFQSINTKIASWKLSKKKEGKVYAMCACVCPYVKGVGDGSVMIIHYNFSIEVAGSEDNK